METLIKATLTTGLFARSSNISKDRVAVDRRRICILKLPIGAWCSPFKYLTWAYILFLSNCSVIDLNAIQYQSQSELDRLTFNSVPPPSFTRGLIARRSVTPLYPVRAVNLRIEGWNLLSFSVGEEGNVIANTIEVIDADPPDVFDRASIAAARQFDFDNFQQEVVEDVQFVFRYQLEELDLLRPADRNPEPQFRELIPIRHLTPNYPESALEQAIEGNVLVEFDVSSTGVVSNISVIESDPPGIFDEDAIKTATRFRFEPRLIFNIPTSVKQVQYRFEWRLPD